MKIVNPFGKEVNSNSGVVADPRGCQCATGSDVYETYAGTRLNAGSCFVCGCSCRSGNTSNKEANRDGAKAKLSY